MSEQSVWFPEKSGCYKEDLLHTMFLLGQRNQTAPSTAFGYWSDRKEIVYASVNKNYDKQNSISIVFAKQLISAEKKQPTCVFEITTTSCPKFNSILESLKSISISSGIELDNLETQTILHGTQYFLDINGGLSHHLSWTNYAIESHISELIRKASDTLEACTKR